MEPVIKVNRLSYNYKRKAALRQVDLTVEKGRVFGIVGENGAGKTTLIKLLLGALCPKEGTVTVFGAEPSQAPESVLARIGYLSEDRDLPEWMRVHELMRYTQAFYPDWDDVYAEQLRGQFRLSLDAKIRTLSRGEKARTGLLMALAHRPDLLILDEPSSGLDTISRNDILGAVIQSVTEEGRTVVFSSHLLDEVERVADDIAMFHNGRLELLMSMEDLRERHQRRIVALPDGIETFPALDCVLQTEGEGREWSVICYGEPDTTRNALASVGARVLEEDVPSLSTVFVARTRANQTAASACPASA